MCCTVAEIMVPTQKPIGSPSSSSSCSISGSLSPSIRVRCLQKQASGLSVSNTCSDSDSGCSNPSTILKRKRPARIDIPMSSLSFAGPAVGQEGPKEVEMESARYAVYCKKGRREAMEDRYAAVVDIEGDSKQAFFGVFDGHGGSRAAEFAAGNMGKNIINEVRKTGDNGIIDAVKSGYLTTDSEFLKEKVHGGTCSVTALMRNGDLVVSNAGDCRAVMSRAGVAEALTIDHRPSREDEKQRIESLGGYVDCCRGVWRIQGSLAVSRGIGDIHLKKWVIAEPETKIVKLKPDSEFLIMASDGLWDKVSNQEAVEMVRPLCMNTDYSHGSSLSACKKLVELSVKRGSADDISVMIIQLRQFI